jgi:hypothetical protein
VDELMAGLAKPEHSPVTGYAYVWRYRARPGAEAAFEEAYGRDGAWVRLFSSDDDYLGTLLLKDRGRSRGYLTVDRWASRASFESFRAEHKAEWDALDRQCEELTELEQEVGQYAVIE